MSLHTLANHLQSAGRGEDKQLVHMTPGEVEGLQAIAMAHGGSLTINPETGLPEAGFLSSILPMVAGLGLTALSGGALSPLMAAGIVGGGTAVATGSLRQGLMAGLGAYGGAGMGAGLMTQGAAGAGAGAASTGSGVGLNAANAGTGVGVNAANAGAGVGLKAQTVFGPNVASTGTGYAGFQNPVLDAGFKNPVALTTPPAVPSAVTNASAYSPTNTGIPAYAKTPYTTQIGEPYRVIELDEPLMRAYTPPAPVPAPVEAVKTYPNLSTLKYGGGWGTAPGGRYFIEDPLAVSGYSPSTATTSQPFARGLQGTTVPSGAVDVSGQSISRPFSDRMSQLGRGFEASTKDFEGLKGLYNAMPTGSVIASGATLASAMKPEDKEPEKQKSLIRPYEFTYGATGADREPYSGSAERLYFNPQFTALTPYEAPGPEYAAEGGLMGYQAGGQIERMAAQNAMGANTGYPMASLQTPMYSNPETQRPEATNVIAPSADAGVGAYTGEARFRSGGISHLGDYSDGGRLLKGPGDGVSDSIPASIGNRQPARLADGEFVVPARIVSEIGNGSTEAGARKLYAMMDRVQKARRKTVGKNQVARNTKAEKLLPA